MNVLFVLLSLLTPQGSDEGSQILLTLEESEHIYDNLSVTWKERFELVANRDEKGIMLNEDSSGWSVRQGGKLFMNVEGNQDHAELEARDIHRRFGFDGKNSRLIDKRNGYVGNVHNKAVYDYRMFDPHALPLRHSMKRVPLSVWLRGKDAVCGHPYGDPSDFDDGRELELKDGGQDDVNGLVCQKVILNSTRPDKKSGGRRVSGHREIWLARDRNFLPVKAIAFNHFYSTELPIEEMTLSDLREIQPGVWFPFGCEVLVYDEIELLDHKRQKLLSERSIVVETVSLNPQYPEAFFQDIQFPKGAAVYEIVDGEITMSRIEGQVAKSEVQLNNASGSPVTRILIFVNVLAACIVGLLWYRKRHSA